MPEMLEEHTEFPIESSLLKELNLLKTHDHVCFLYETPQEWQKWISGFILLGLQKGEKCIYVYDTHTASQVRTALREGGIDTKAAEAAGQLSIFHGNRVYMKNGYFDPDRVIAFLIEESQQALVSGYTALRITGERDWVERSLPGSAKLMEYEARLNRDILPQIPCLGICQYDSRKLDVELIRGLIVTHPKLIRRGRVYSNLYFLPPEIYFSTNRSEKEIQLIFKSIELEDRLEHSLHESEKRFNAIFENTSDAIFVVEVIPGKPFRFISANPLAQKIIRHSVTDTSGIPVEECFPEDVCATIKANFNRCISAGDTIRYTETFDIAGKKCCFNTTLIPSIDIKGHVFQITGISDEISTEKD